MARRRAAGSRSRQQQQQKQRKQEDSTTTVSSSSSKSSSNRSAPTTLVKATSTQKKRQRANAAALGAAARNAPEKDGYKKLTQEDEAKLCANIKVRRKGRKRKKKEVGWAEIFFVLTRLLCFSTSHPLRFSAPHPPTPKKELRRLETLEPPIGPQSTPSQHAAAWAEAASVPSAAELARRVAAGRDSERRLLEAHAGLAHALASAATPLGIAGGRRASMRSSGAGQAAAAGLEHGDFLGEARAALLRAAAAYDPTRGSSLSSLAALAGRRSLGDYAAAHGRTVAAPKSARYAVAAMAKARRALVLEREEKKVGEGAGGAGGGEEYQPTFEEVAKAAGLSPAAARAAFAATRAESGFEGFGAFVSSKAGGGGSQAALDEGTEDDGAAAAASSATMTTVSAASSGVVSEFTVFESAAAASLSGTSSSDDDGGGMDRDGMERSRWWAKQQQRDLSEKLSALLATMPARDREAVRLRYGLDGGAPRSWAEVGAALRPPVGGEAIRQALAKRSAALAVGRGGRGAAEALRALRSLVEVQDDDDSDDDEEDDDGEDGEGGGGAGGRGRGRGSSSGAKKAAPPLPLPPRAKAAAASKKPSSSAPAPSPPPPPPVTPSSSSPASISRSSPWEEDVKARA